jgi:RNA polymerase sigma factor (sigma-70 family)
MPGGEADLYLLEGVQRGDQNAWREVIERYQGRLLSFARRMLAQPDEAEDLVQETFLGLLRSIVNYDHSRSLETYLFAILRHKLSDHFRAGQKGQRQSLDSLELDETPAAWLERDTPSRYLATQENLGAQRRALVAGLRNWVEQCRTQGRFQDLIVIEMLVVLGLRNKEVASDLGLSEPAVAGVKFRVLDQWRKLTRAAAEQAAQPPPAAGHSTPEATGGADSAAPAPDWQEADLARDSTVGRVWREDGISCLKRSTLGRFLLGALDEDWNEYVDFHVHKAGCDRCTANLDDLRVEDARDAQSTAALRERCFASSVGFLSRKEG